MAAAAPHPRAALHAAHTSASFLPAMVEAAERAGPALAAAPSGRVVDVVARDDPGHPRRAGADDLHPGRADATRMRSAAPSPAISRRSGRVDPLDIFGFPDWVPRIGRLRARPAIRFFEEMVGELIDGPQGAPRQRRARAARSSDPAARGGRSGDRQGPDRHRGAGQHRHLHRRRPRDHGERPVLVALPPVAGRAGPRAGRAGGRRGARRAGRSSRSIWSGSSTPAPSSTRRCGSIRRRLS